ncbi:hypothetical protein ACN6LA_000908 [Streptomyces sp. SAS_269]|uniref:hypothetical protein n=1 Tax=Streptomyces sp. SAS_269 TaxID=3412749 RepID=UPI00403D0E0A
MRIPANAANNSRQRAHRTLARYKKSPVCMALSLLVLLLTTMVLGCFGVADLESALNFPGRVTGAALIVAAIITFLGAAAVVDHWIWHCFPYAWPPRSPCPSWRRPGERRSPPRGPRRP